MPPCSWPRLNHLACGPPGSAGIGARAAYEEAAAAHQADAEANAVAAWLGLVRIRVTKIAADDERLIHDTIALAAVLVERSRPELPLVR